MVLLKQKVKGAKEEDLVQSFTAKLCIGEKKLIGKFIFTRPFTKLDFLCKFGERLLQ